MSTHEDTPAVDDTPTDLTPTPEETVVVDTPPETPDDGEETEVPEKVFTPDSKPMSFTQTKPVTKPITGAEPKLDDCIAVLRETQEVVKQVFEQHAAVLSRMTEREHQLMQELSRTRDSAGDELGNPHLRLLLGALTRQIQDEQDLHDSTLYRDGSHWVQAVEHEGKQLGAGIPVQRLADGRYSREELLSYVTRKAGVGAPVDIPLWHSGIWLRFRAPSLVELTSLNQEVANIKVGIGSATRGLAFSNVSHFVKNVVIDFALQHVAQANVSFNTPTDLKPLIDVRDIPALYLGLAATLYPNGYPYAVPCVADPANCNHIVKELIQCTALWWVDTNSLTPWQRQHMATRINERAPKRPEDIATYKSHHQHGGERLVWIDNMGFLLACPNVYDHEKLGHDWLNGIIEMTQGAFNEPPEGQNRGAFIQQLAESTSAREYTHWVKAIVETDDDAPDGYRVLSDEKDFIATVLGSVYSADEHIDVFVRQVEKYIDDSLIAMVAIPTYNCPSCNTPTAEKFKERFDNLVPIDPLTEFFTLGIRKLSRVV